MTIEITKLDEGFATTSIKIDVKGFCKKEAGKEIKIFFETKRSKEAAAKFIAECVGETPAQEDYSLTLGKDYEVV